VKVLSFRRFFGEIDFEFEEVVRNICGFMRQPCCFVPDRFYFLRVPVSRTSYISDADHGRILDVCLLTAHRCLRELLYFCDFSWHGDTSLTTRS
jgi:hypothetical protein